MAANLEKAFADGSLQTNLAAAGIPVVLSAVTAQSATSVLTPSVALVAEAVAKSHPPAPSSQQEETENQGNRQALGLGVGLGVGISAIVVVVALIVLRKYGPRGSNSVSPSKAAAMPNQTS